MRMLPLTWPTSHGPKVSLVFLLFLAAAVSFGIFLLAGRKGEQGQGKRGVQEQKHTVRAIFRAIANVKRSSREPAKNHPQPPTTHPTTHSQKTTHLPPPPLAWVSLLLFLLLLLLFLLPLDQKKKCFA